MHQELLVKGTRYKENKGKTKKQTQQLSCYSHLDECTEDMSEKKTKAQEKNYKAASVQLTLEIC